MEGAGHYLVGWKIRWLGAKIVRGRDGGPGLSCVSRSWFGASAKERVAVLWKGAPCTLVLGGWMCILGLPGHSQWKVREKTQWHPSSSREQCWVLGETQSRIPEIILPGNKVSQPPSYRAAAFPPDSRVVQSRRSCGPLRETWLLKGPTPHQPCLLPPSCCS